ncbi:uncharacterized protein LOC111036266 [Myzus persicae]|uniref:uncharacterized protein LOC111036266 n=1 Tax=Myzus persicae TaxID=13164 RepID=UPI000B935B8E|nr:uncharacterized protein LOC111036266 [Myzus persicae]
MAPAALDQGPVSSASPEVRPPPETRDAASSRLRRRAVSMPNMAVLQFGTVESTGGSMNVVKFIDGSPKLAVHETSFNDPKTGDGCSDWSSIRSDDSQRGNTQATPPFVLEPYKETKKHRTYDGEPYYSIADFHE